MNDACWVGSVLHGVTSRTLGGHEVGYGASGAQSSRGGIGVEVWLGGEVGSSSSSQVRVDCAMTGAVVRKGVRSLSNCRSDVGLLTPVRSGTIRCDVLLGLKTEKQQDAGLDSLLGRR